ncbi:MAG: hypothetical protein NTZ17_13995, partial [Phycisphaerae bacterium]|nr:hypothetical protein [Phycisphaerae bacterium]
ILLPTLRGLKLYPKAAISRGSGATMRVASGDARPTSWPEFATESQPYAQRPAAWAAEKI